MFRWFSVIIYMCSGRGCVAGMVNKLHDRFYKWLGIYRSFPTFQTPNKNPFVEFLVGVWRREVYPAFLALSSFLFVGVQVLRRVASCFAFSMIFPANWSLWWNSAVPHSIFFVALTRCIHECKKHRLMNKWTRTIGDSTFNS